MAFQNYSPPELPINIRSFTDSPHLNQPFDTPLNQGSPINTSDNVSSGTTLLDRFHILSIFSPLNSTKPYRKSTDAAWQRAYSKYSPSTEVLVSPIKASQVNLQGIWIANDDKENEEEKEEKEDEEEDEDDYISISIWIVNMSEQFFYDNTLLLMNNSKQSKERMNLLLRHNSKEIKLKFFENLTNITFLGEGGFGKVYSASDVNTGKTFAIKYISIEAEDLVEHCKNILNYMSERNSTVRANDSPFVVKFYYSLQTKMLQGLFLFFEYCIGDLYNYISNVSYYDYEFIAQSLKANSANLVDELDNELELLEVALVYIFELFCGLDFLVRSNIIHQDIKPDNLMVSEKLHLKIGDFGLIYRTRCIHRKSNRELVKHDEIDLVESSDYRVCAPGTDEYQDFEIKLITLKDENHPDFERFLHNKAVFNTPGIRFKDDNLEPTFLTDTWAAGVVSVGLLLRGFDILDPFLLETTLFEDVPQNDRNVYLMHLVGRQRIYNEYIFNGLLNAGGESHEELMRFLASIFLPRPIRAQQYVKEKEIYQFSRKRLVRYVDFEKIEKFPSFKDRNFTRENIFLLELPGKVKEFFSDEKISEFSNFKELLRDLSNETSKEHTIDLTPGLVINNFN